MVRVACNLYYPASRRMYPHPAACAAITAYRCYDVLPGLQAWLKEWLASGLFGAVMEKYAPWREGDAPVAVFGPGAAAFQPGV